MARKNGQVGSPSSTQPELPLARAARRERLRLRTEKQKALQPPSQLGRRHPQPKPDLVPITLQMRHSVNGKFYGPGTVMVSPVKAEMFRNTEHEAAQKELSLVQQQAFIIGFGNAGPVKRQVPYARFDEILMREG